MFGKRIAALRAEKQLTQKELAKQLNVSSAAIGMYETEQRKLDIDKIFTFCDFFGVSTDYLLGRSEERILNLCNCRSSHATSDKKQLLDIYSNLDARNKEVILNISQTLLSSQTSKDCDFRNTLSNS